MRQTTMMCSKQLLIISSLPVSSCARSVGLAPVAAAYFTKHRSLLSSSDGLLSSHDHHAQYHTSAVLRRWLQSRIGPTLFNRAEKISGCSMLTVRDPKLCIPQPTYQRSYVPWRTKDFVPDLQRFLCEIGTDPKEARFWLKQFLNVKQAKPFAILEVDPEVFASSAQVEHLVSAVSFLQRNSLRPVLVFGDPPSTLHGERKSLQGCSVNIFEKEQNKPKTMSLNDLQAAFAAKSCALSEALSEQGLESGILFAGSNVIEVESSKCTRVKQVNPALIQWCVQRQTVPIIPTFGETATGQIVHLKMWDVTAAIARQLQPLKVIKVNSHGGFEDEKLQIIPNINLPFDFQAAKEKSWCTRSVVQTIYEVSSLLSQLPEDTSVVITAADKVLQELFTHHGSGTFLKVTEPIRKHKCLKDVDIERLTVLFTKSFKRPLSETYFESIKNSINTIYLSERYTAAAVVVNVPDCDVPYLCKFAVSAQAQGEGTGEILWEAIQRDFRHLYWRSRGSNPVNPWYFRKSEGSWSNGTWTVFWYGIPEPIRSTTLINMAMSAPDSFSLPDPSTKQPKTVKS